MNKQHEYELTVTWTGNKGQGTQSYDAYERSHTISKDQKKDLFCSADPAFRGDLTKYNPEELLLASIASCHMLWYLHLCSDAGVIVIDYHDTPVGVMQESITGGRFTSVTLQPDVVVANADMIEKAHELHQKAHKACFIANSCNFPIYHEAICRI